MNFTRKRNIELLKLLLDAAVKVQADPRPMVAAEDMIRRDRNETPDALVNPKLLATVANLMKAVYTATRRPSSTYGPDDKANIERAAKLVGVGVIEFTTRTWFWEVSCSRQQERVARAQKREAA